jgi:hypothetical protein
MLLSFDRTLNGSSDDFDGGMIDGGIDRGKSGFFSGVDDPLFEGGIFFDCFDRFDGNEGGVVGLVGGGDSIARGASVAIEQFFDLLSGLGKVLGVDDFFTGG